MPPNIPEMAPTEPRGHARAPREGSVSLLKLEQEISKALRRNNRLIHRALTTVDGVSARPMEVLDRCTTLCFSVTPVVFTTFQEMF